jgi:hypothetical protein
MRYLTLIAVTVAGLALPSAALALNEAEALQAALAHAVPNRAVEIQSSGQTTFGRAEAVFSGEDGLSAARQNEPAFPFVVTATGGEQFHPLFAPPGHEPPSEPYESVVVSVGWTTTTLSPTLPLISRLGTVVKVSLPSGAVAAAGKSCHVDELLTSALKRKHLRARAASAASALTRCEQRR